MQELFVKNCGIEEEKAMSCCSLAELYSILGDDKKVEEYRRLAYECSVNIESEYDYHLIIMESWILGYQKRYKEAYEMYCRYENSSSMETGQSNYAEYCFFRDAM